MSLSKYVGHKIVLILILLVLAGVAYAAVIAFSCTTIYCSVPNDNISYQIKNLTVLGGSCINIANGNGNGIGIFVPGKTLAEWNAFTGNRPSNVSLSSPAGQACTSLGNSCGMTNPGTKDSCGICSATIPDVSLCTPTCHYQLSPYMTVCSASMGSNQFPYGSAPNLFTLTCGQQSDVGKYILGNPAHWADNSCNPGDYSYGDHVRYGYQVCNEVCSGGGSGSSCPLPWGGQVADGSVVTGYSSGVPAWGPVQNGVVSDQPNCNSSSDIGNTHMLSASTYETCIASCSSSNGTCSSTVLGGLGTNTNQSCTVPSTGSWHYSQPQYNSVCGDPSSYTMSGTCNNPSDLGAIHMLGPTHGACGGTNILFDFKLCTGLFY